MLHAGLHLSRRRVNVCLLWGQGEIDDEWASPPDADGLRLLYGVGFTPWSKSPRCRS